MQYKNMALLLKADLATVEGNDDDANNQYVFTITSAHYMKSIKGVVKCFKFKSVEVINSFTSFH